MSFRPVLRDFNNPIMQSMPFIHFLCTSPSNFTLDASHFSHPDLYLSSAITVYGGDPSLENSIAQPLPQASPPPPPTMFESLGDVMDDRRRSNVGYFYVEFAFVWLLIWVTLSIKIYEYPLGI
ncbi:hypothetical protein V6N13_000609 [Hibiscus sabdariffa]|uniref:Uncharacterized protein n=1 Tax=Hibiscus sabdariffa TaxID=183260 RepID=A0ABR2G6J0_9ROSI